jgi:biotin transport system substrate-specific component
VSVTSQSSQSTRASERVGPWLVNLVLILGFASFSAVSAYIRIDLPFSPVPITAQTLAVLLAGLCLGSRRGAAAQIAYVGEGLLGLPVFAGGTNAWSPSAAGVPVILGPTAGYLVGFVAAAFVVGWLSERGWSNRVQSLLFVLVLSNLVIYAFGALWLTHFVPGGLPSAIAAGILPFVVGDGLKIVVAAGVVPSARRILEQIALR